MLSLRRCKLVEKHSDKNKNNLFALFNRSRFPEGRTMLHAKGEREQKQS